MFRHYDDVLLPFYGSDGRFPAHANTCGVYGAVSFVSGIVNSNHWSVTYAKALLSLTSQIALSLSLLIELMNIIPDLLQTPCQGYTS
jgi:hypothetical protein